MVRADPGRTLERLVELRLVERLVPVTEDPRRTRRRTYRIADNFLAFWLGLLDRYRPEIDAVVLAGRSREAVLVGEEKWSKRVDGARLQVELERKAEVLPDLAPELRYGICARERVDNAGDALVTTAADIFGT